MPRNIEIKAKIQSIDAIVRIVELIANEGPTQIAQDDTFFNCETGRLKLRTFSKNRGELIFYQRANDSGPKQSFYVRTQTDDPAGLGEALKLAYGVVGRVIKHRVLYIVGRTRIHLDRVEGLGEYLELEVVLTDSESIEAGVAQANALLAKLGIESAQLVDKAYVDLLSETQS
jgi:predicted adenylyl cyclase CyaB